LISAKKFLKFVLIKPLKNISMTKKILLISCTILFFAACKKSSSTPQQKPSTMGLLTGKEWIYTEIYHDFDGTSGTLIYKRGSSSNIENWDAGRVVYWPAGLTDEWGPTGSYIQGEWQMNNDSTQMSYTNSVGIDSYTRIMLLDESNFVWYDSIAHVEGKMTLK
jgi:hypothetical protein